MSGFLTLVLFSSGLVFQVDVVCGDHLLDRYQSLKEVQNFVGEEALQVSSRTVPQVDSGLAWSVMSSLSSSSSVLLQDGLLVLHFGLVLPAED